jgi:hypothetical protein
MGGKQVKELEQIETGNKGRYHSQTRSCDHFHDQKNAYEKLNWPGDEGTPCAQARSERSSEASLQVTSHRKHYSKRRNQLSQDNGCFGRKGKHLTHKNENFSSLVKDMSL